MTFPWDKPQLPAVPIADTVKLLQADFTYAMTHTCVRVHSSRPELQMLVNTARGQIIPRGEGKFTDGTTLEFQDIGMPQPKLEAMSVEQLVQKVLGIAADLNLEIAP